jgi:hypothetical protein
VPRCTPHLPPTTTSPPCCSTPQHCSAGSETHLGATLLGKCTLVSTTDFGAGSLPSNRCAWWKGSARSSQHACAPRPPLCTPRAMRSATGDGVCGAHSLQPSHPTSHPAARASPAPSGTCVWAGVLPRCPITLSPTPSPVPATRPPPLPTLCTPSATCSTLRSTAQTTKSHLLTTSSGAQP